MKKQRIPRKLKKKRKRPLGVKISKAKLKKLKWIDFKEWEFFTNFRYDVINASDYTQQQLVTRQSPKNFLL